MVTPNKQRILAKLFSHLGKTYSDQLPEDLSVLDHLLLAVVQQGTSLSVALPTYRKLVAGFHDLNELRVSHSAELVDFLSSIPDKESKARRILGILQFVFETTYAFDLEPMRKKPLKQAQKQLSKISGTNSFIVAATVQRALGGHALPVDAGMLELLERLELVDGAEEGEQARAGLEHLVPKAKGISFCLLVSELLADAKHQESHLQAINPKVKPKARAKESKGGKEPKESRNEAKPAPAKSVGTKSAAPRKTTPERRSPKEKK